MMKYVHSISIANLKIFYSACHIFYFVVRQNCDKNYTCGTKIRTIMRRGSSQIMHQKKADAIFFKDIPDPVQVWYVESKTDIYF